MNHKIPILTVALGLLFAALAMAQPAPERAGGGQEMVARAAVWLQKQPSISAKLRQRVHLFGQELVGTGHYLQMADGRRTLLRFEMSVQVGRQATSLQQVVDGRFLWVRRQLPEQTTVGRVDLRRLKKAISNSAAYPTSEWLAVGGLPYMLEQLAKNFRFEEPQKKRLGELDVYQLEGVWQPQQKSIASNGAGQGSGAAQLPERVTLVVSDKDLFPYQLTFWKTTTDATGRRKSVPLLSVEFFEIQIGAEIDPLQFVFKPTEYEDYTPQYLAKFGVANGSNTRTANTAAPSRQ